MKQQISVTQIQHSPMKSISLVWPSTLFLWSHCWFASSYSIFLCLAFKFQKSLKETLIKLDTVCLPSTSLIWKEMRKRTSLCVEPVETKSLLLDFYGTSTTTELTKLNRGMACENPQDFTRQQSEVTVKVRIPHYRLKYRNKPEGMKPGGRSAYLMVF